jgi:hypothetical protein
MFAAPQQLLLALDNTDFFLFNHCATVAGLQAPSADTGGAPSDSPTSVPGSSSTPPPTAVSSGFFGDGSATSTPVSAAVPGLPVIDNNGTDAPASSTGAGTGAGSGSGTVDNNGTDGVLVPGNGGLPVFPGGASTPPPSAVDPAVTDTPFDAPPSAAPTAAPSAVSSLGMLLLLRLLFAHSKHAVATVY